MDVIITYWSRWSCVIIVMGWVLPFSSTNFCIAFVGVATVPVFHVGCTGAHRPPSWGDFTAIIAQHKAVLVILVLQICVCFWWCPLRRYVAIVLVATEGDSIHWLGFEWAVRAGTWSVPAQPWKLSTWSGIHLLIWSHIKQIETHQKHCNTRCRNEVLDIFHIVRSITVRLWHKTLQRVGGVTAPCASASHT